MSWKLSVEGLGTAERDRDGRLHLTGVLAELGIEESLPHLAPDTVGFVGGPARRTSDVLAAGDGSLFEQQAWEHGLATLGRVDVVEASTFPQIESVPGRIY